VIHPEPFHVLTVGWGRQQVDSLWNAIAARSTDRFSHILHPRFTRSDYASPPAAGLHFLHDDECSLRVADADRALLASLEREDIPTVHNMILGDRVVSHLPHEDALAYATFLARRLAQLYTELQPSVVIGSYDAIHSGIALAVARRMSIPWFALNFSVIPQGLACFCERQSPASRVHLFERSPEQMRPLAQESLAQFEARRLQAYAYLAPQPSAVQRVARLPARFAAVARTLSDARQVEKLRFTDAPTSYSLTAALEQMRHMNYARKASRQMQALNEPPAAPYVLFGLHLQPESSIDVWAPFFSNQMWVIELLSRAIPPDYRLLVKIHKSDVSRYSSEELARMRSFPGVELVRPFADTRRFIESASLMVGIQGTMALEAALLGKPVIMLGDSPVSAVPNVSRIGSLEDLPKLIRAALAAPAPSRASIVSAFASYLTPFLPASHNDWRVTRTPQEIEHYVQLFARLREYLERKAGTKVP
jgi:hypothetical protein